MDVYWVEAWLVDNSHGLHARGLLGAIAHLLAPHGPDVVILNAIVVAVSVGIVATLAFLLYVHARSVWSRLAIGVLLASPLCALFFEELGDPLMVAFALFLITAGCLNWIRNRTAKVLLVILCSLTVIAVHEAALFLFVPALALIGFGSGRPGYPALFGYVALAVPLLIAIVVTKAPQLPESDYRSYNSMTHEVIPRDKEPFPVYSQLLREEADNYFGSPVKIVQFVLKFPRVWCISLIALVLVSALLSGSATQTLWAHFLYLTFCSAPLYVIAHDWGRFSIITFWLALVTVWMRARDTTPPAPVFSHWLRRLIPERVPPEPLLFGVASALMLGASALYPDFGINGMPALSLPIVIPTLIALVRWHAWSRQNTGGVPQV
jgi:hypothetical protein